MIDEYILKHLQDVFLWGLVIRHIPELKKDIERILSEYENDK